MRGTPGRAVYIRVNPRNLMVCDEVMQRTGLYKHGMSLAQAVSRTLDVLVEMAIRNKLLAEPEEFKLAETLARYQGDQRTKLDITLQDRERAAIEASWGDYGRGRFGDLERAEQLERAAAVGQGPSLVPPHLRRQRTRLLELLSWLEAQTTVEDFLNFTAREELLHILRDAAPWISAEEHARVVALRERIAELPGAATEFRLIELRSTLFVPDAE